MVLRQGALSRINRLFGDNPPSLRLVFADGEAFNFTPEPTVTIIMRNAKIWRALLSGRMDSLGDAYVKGDLVVDGPIDEVLRVGLRIAAQLGRFSRANAWLWPLRRLVAAHSRRSDGKAIEHHYDVSSPTSRSPAISRRGRGRVLSLTENTRRR